MNEEEWLENNKKLKEVNRKWLEEYDSSGISTNESSVKGADEDDTRKTVGFQNLLHLHALSESLN